LTKTAAQRQLRALLVSGLEPILEEDAVEPPSLPKVKEEADLGSATQRHVIVLE
jgi:hypothetical protein